MEQKKTMTKQEAEYFAKQVMRSALFEEMRMNHGYPFFLKGVRATLIELGYDYVWVEHEFEPILSKEAGLYEPSKPTFF